MFKDDRIDWQAAAKDAQWREVPRGPSMYDEIRFFIAMLIVMLVAFSAMPFLHVYTMAG